MRRLMRGCLVVLLVLVVIVVALYVARGIHGTVRLADRKEEARELVHDAYAERDATVTTMAQLRPRLAPLGQPVRAWSGVDCRIGRRESGWIVEEYQQECDAVAVEIYAVDGQDARAVATRLGGDYVGTSACPAILDLWGYDDVAPRQAQARWFPAEPGSDDGPWCRLPEPTGNAEETVHRPLDADAYLVVDVRQPLDPVSLGCDPWTTLLFCERPVDDVLWPEG